MYYLSTLDLICALFGCNKRCLRRFFDGIIKDIDKDIKRRCRITYFEAPNVYGQVVIAFDAAIEFIPFLCSVKKNQSKRNDAKIISVLTDMLDMQ